MDNHTDKDGNNGFTLACYLNPNLDVIKYLVEETESSYCPLLMKME
jgi:hypothetical protein